MIYCCVQPVDGNRDTSVKVTPIFWRNFVFIQGNAPPHSAQDTTTFLEQSGAEVMDRPAQCLDMNLIEHMQDQMSVWIGNMGHPPSNIDEL